MANNPISKQSCPDTACELHGVQGQADRNSNTDRVPELARASGTMDRLAANVKHLR